MRPYDRLTWFLEVLPVLIAAPLLVATHRSFPLTPLAYWLIAVHSLILILGGHYTYARVPLGFWMQDAFDFARNHYDRIGHLMQGFGPAIIIRELLLRTSPLAPGKWLFTIVLFTVPRRQRHLRVHRVVGGACRRARRPARSSARRATPGTRSGTCSSPAAAPSPRSSCSLACMTGSSRRWIRPSRQGGTACMSFRRHAPLTYRWARRIAVALVGGTVLLVGVALIVLPGPAFVVIPLGLAILGLEFAGACVGCAR